MTESSSFTGSSSSSLRTSKRSLAHRGARIGTGALLVGAAPALALLSTSTADASTITVANTNDSGSGSLRDALAGAAPGDTIDLSGLSGTININSQLAIANNVTIIGPGAANLSVTGTSGTIFKFTGSSGLTTISGLTMTGATANAIQCFGMRSADLKLEEVIVTGNSGNYAGGMYFMNCGSLEVVDSTFSNNNSTYYEGGGIQFGGTDSVTITGSTFDNNSISTSRYSRGGGAYIQTSGSISIADSTFINNYSYYGGAGVNLHSNDVTITGSTFSNNTNGWGNGGGAFIQGSGNGGNALISNSTFADNSGRGAAGLAASDFDTVTISASTLSGNSVTNKASALYLRNSVNDIYNSTIVDNAGAPAVYTNGNLNMKFVTVTGNDASGNIAGLYFTNGVGVVDSSIIVGNGATPGASLGNYQATVTITQSLLSDFTAANIATDGTDVTGVTDAGLGSLTDNGGPTLTKALLASSPAIDLVTTLPAPFIGSSFDQRGTGYGRVAGSYADAGAFEYGAVAPTTTSSTSSTSTTSTTTPSSTSTTLAPTTTTAAGDDASVSTEAPTPDSTVAGGLPTTGTDSFPLVAAGSALIVLGGAGAAFAARRRQTFGSNVR